MDDAIIRAQQSDVINAMVIVDNSPALNDVIASQRIITRSASTMKLLRSHLDEFPNTHAPPNKPHNRNRYGRTIMMIHTVLGQACFEEDRRPVIEAVTSKLLHLVEWWSSTGSAVVLSEPSLYQWPTILITYLCPEDIELFTVILWMGVKRTDAKLQEDILNQLRTVAFRMDSRLDVNPEVVNAWNVAYIFATEYCPDIRVRHSGPICANIGCESAVPAGMACSRCVQGANVLLLQSVSKGVGSIMLLSSLIISRNRIPNSDWKPHKPYCKKIRVDGDPRCLSSETNCNM